MYLTLGGVKVSLRCFVLRDFRDLLWDDFGDHGKMNPEGASHGSGILSLVEHEALTQMDDTSISGIICCLQLSIFHDKTTLQVVRYSTEGTSSSKADKVAALGIFAAPSISRYSH